MAASFRTKQLATVRAGMDRRRARRRRVPRAGATRRRDAEGADARRGGRGVAREPRRRRRTDREHAPLGRRPDLQGRTDLRDRRIDELTVDDVTATGRRARRERLQARDDQQDARRARDGARPPRRRAEPGPRQAREAAEGAQGRTCRRRSPSTSSGSPRRLPRHHVLPLLIVDECGPRVNELATAQVGDLDEHRKAIRVRWTVEKNDRYRHLELPDDLFDALLATLPPREDRDLEAPLFPDLTDAAAADGDHEGVQGDRDAALLAARPAPPARVAALQAHRLARRGRRATRRLEAGRGRPLRLRAHRLPRGRSRSHGRVRRVGRDRPCRTRAGRKPRRGRFAGRCESSRRHSHPARRARTAWLSQAVCAIRVHRASRCWPRCGPRERANLGPDRRRIASWPDRPSSTSSGASPPRSTRTARARATRRR